MANNYSPCTVTPDLPKDLFTEEELESLAAHGFTYHENSNNTLYYYSEEGFSEAEDEDDTDPFEVFQRALKRSTDIDEIVIEGANYCSKMRPGEFGGYLIRITKDDVQLGSTQWILELFREGKL